MERNPIVLLIAAVFAVVLCVTMAHTLVYLMRGYSLVVGGAGLQPETFHLAFPTTRIVAAVLLWCLGLAAIGLFAAGHGRARLLSWMAFAVGLIIGVWDVFEYGMMGSPTSVWALLLLLLLALATQFRDRLVRATS